MVACSGGAQDASFRTGIFRRRKSFWTWNRESVLTSSVRSFPRNRRILGMAFLACVFFGISWQFLVAPAAAAKKRLCVEESRLAILGVGF